MSTEPSSIPTSIPTPLISSPALPLIAPTHIFSEGQKVAFIYNRLTAVPAIITSCNPDGTYDITATIPKSEPRVKFKNKNQDFKRTITMELTEQSFQNVRVGDPTVIYVKVGIPLDTPQVDESRGVRQTHIDRYQDSGKRLRTPRFHEFHTNIIGNIFNPSLYCFRVWGWRAEMEVEKGVKIPEESRIWPDTQKGTEKGMIVGGYLPFTKAFQVYFKQFYQKVGKWNRVELQTFLIQDVMKGKTNMVGEDIQKGEE